MPSIFSKLESLQWHNITNVVYLAVVSRHEILDPRWILILDQNLLVFTLPKVLRVNTSLSSQSSESYRLFPRCYEPDIMKAGLSAKLLMLKLVLFAHEWKLIFAFSLAFIMRFKATRNTIQYFISHFLKTWYNIIYVYLVNLKFYSY